MSADDDLEWEEWDGSGKFWHHCVAGSIAGVSEHTLMYPFDTAKTYLQACAECPHTASSVTKGASQHKLSSSAMPRPGMWTTMRHIVTTAELNSTGTVSKTAGMTRLWRGVQAIVVGCIPAHAFFFSTYEVTKHALLNDEGSLSATSGMMAGAAAAVSHDVVMAPFDTVKQRLQLGHYQGMMDALQQMIRFEGYVGLFRSFPITLLTNVPYGAVMVSTNEVVKHRLMVYHQREQLDVSTCLLASSMGGMAAAATTTPLDRVKTFLQTQQLQPACNQGSCPKFIGEPIACWRQALSLILKNEGPAGLFKGMVPRVITHTPAVAISWTAYETAKQWLASAYM